MSVLMSRRGVGVMFATLAAASLLTGCTGQSSAPVLEHDPEEVRVESVSAPADGTNEGAAVIYVPAFDHGVAIVVTNVWRQTLGHTVCKIQISWSVHVNAASRCVVEPVERDSDGHLQGVRVRVGGLSAGSNVALDMDVKPLLQEGRYDWDYLHGTRSVYRLYAEIPTAEEESR